MKSLHPHPSSSTKLFILISLLNLSMNQLFITLNKYYFTIFTEREREIQSSPPPFKLIFSDLCIHFTDVKLYDLYSLSSLT